MIQPTKQYIHAETAQARLGGAITTGKTPFEMASHNIAQLTNYIDSYAANIAQLTNYIDSYAAG
jgi:hypothetical protein